MCNATKTTAITITVDDFEPVEFTFRDTNAFSTRGGFNISLLARTPDPDIDLISQFLVEVEFTAITKTVTVTCETFSDNDTLSIIFDSKYNSQKLYTIL